MRHQLLIVLILCQSVIIVKSHVSLTFPPSRKFSLDFLNNLWTPPPCGMPKGSFKTSLIAGSTVNITWHLGYAHSGGYKLELLNGQGDKLADLTPTDDNEFVQGKTTAQWHLIKFPSNTTCQNCLLRLLRQVPEFSPTFAFWSCADVDVVGQSSYVETCSRRGKYSEVTKSCTCCKKRWGSRCQYEDECSKDSDCLGNGKCIDLGGSALPRNQCFCSEDRFGEKCEKLNPSSLPTISNPAELSKYFKIPFGDRMTLYFKRLFGSREDDDVIEFVLEINGTSWAGVGWRPLELSPICKSWPFISDALDPDKKPSLVSQSDINTRKTSSNSSAVPEEPQYQYIPSEWSAQDPFTPMDCTDIVMGAAIGKYARIRDFYARGRHTPQMDTFWGGNDDLLGATGWEKDSKTTLIFRRQVKTRDGPDHPLKGDLLLIYARGQQPGECVKDPQLQLEKGNPIISKFYTPDEYKYHGLGDSQRGLTYMDFSETRTRKP